MMAMTIDSDLTRNAHGYVVQCALSRWFDVPQVKSTFQPAGIPLLSRASGDKVS
jgi:hypothetical protein